MRCRRHSTEGGCQQTCGKTLLCNVAPVINYHSRRVLLSSVRLLSTTGRNGHGNVLNHRRIERYLQAPYPNRIIPLHNQLLWKEVFRRGSLTAKPHDPTLPDAYHHTALEHKGDHLTRFIADEVSIFWTLQFCDNYPMASRYFNSHNVYPVTSLVRNDHWRVLCKLTDTRTSTDCRLIDTVFRQQARQFSVHENHGSNAPDSIGSGRLADNFEAYIYALYLDQGLDRVYEFLCPIFLKKLYSEAKQVNLPVPPSSVPPTSIFGIDIDPQGRYFGRWFYKREFSSLRASHAP